MSSFLVTHFFRKENHCVDELADIGFSIQTHLWWDSIPPPLLAIYIYIYIYIYIIYGGLLVGQVSFSKKKMNF